MHEFAVTAIHRSCIRTEATGLFYRSQFECHIGPLKVYCDIEHVPPGPPKETRHFGVAEEILGASRTSPPARAEIIAVAARSVR